MAFCETAAQPVLSLFLVLQAPRIIRAPTMTTIDPRTYLTRSGARARTAIRTMPKPIAITAICARVRWSCMPVNGRPD